VLEKEFREAWRLFRQEVDPKYKKEFATQIAQCRRKQGFAAIKL
jgi:hypothetical protein